MRRLSAVIVYLSSVAGFFAATAATAFAQGWGGKLTNPFGTCEDLSCLVTKITKFLMVIAPAIASIMILVGAFQMITAGGDPVKFSSGKKTLLYAAIGLLVALLADSIVVLVTKIFT